MKSKVKQERFMLVQDNSSHWYVIPASRRVDWCAWGELSADDEASWEAPTWAERVGGSYTLVTFTDPKIG